MTELTILRELQPGQWVAEAEGRHVLVREIAVERLATYQAAADLVLPIPRILYAGPDADGTRQLVVEAIVGEGAGDPEAGAWRSVTALAPLFTGCPARIAVALARATEALAWLHAARFVHGHLTARTLHFHPGGSVCLAGLDCLQHAVTNRLPCIAYSRSAPCVEQLTGYVIPATDVRLLGLAIAHAYLGRQPLVSDVNAATEAATTLARRGVTLDGEHPVLRLVERMCAPEPEDRPTVRELLETVRLVAAENSGQRRTSSTAAV